MSVSWAPPVGPNDSGFVVIYADVDPDDDVVDASEAICLYCVLEEGGEQLGRGLDLSRVHGQVDWDVDAGEWFVPEAAR